MHGFILDGIIEAMPVFAKELMFFQLTITRQCHVFCNLSFASLKFYFYEEIKCQVPEEHKKDIVVKLLCGSVASLLGQTFTYPLDVFRRQIQVVPSVAIVFTVYDVRKASLRVPSRNVIEVVTDKSNHPSLHS